MKIEKFNKKVQSDLEPTEKVLAYVPVAPKGTLEAAVLSSAGTSAGLNTVGGIAGAAVGSQLVKGMSEKKLQEGNAELQAAGLNLEKHPSLIAGLTEKRLLLWNVKFFGGPKKLVAAINREDIENLVLEKSKLLMMPMPALRVTVKGGNTFELLVAKIKKKRAQELLDRYKSM